MSTPAFSRRVVLTGLAAAPLAARAESDRAFDPRRSAMGIVKLQGDLDDTRVTPWWYEVALYGVVGDAVPKLLLRAEGCETYAIRADAGGVYRSRGATVTAFKDPVSGQWLDRFANPYTGQPNAVHSNVIVGASAVYPPDGSVPLPDNSSMRPSQIAPAPAPSAPTGWLRWIEAGDRVCCIMERRSTGSVQPLMETASLWTDRATFFDPSVTRCEAVFVSTFASPWLGWMDMKERPGHLLWHSTGHKLRTLADLPIGFRQRAERLAPGRLEADPYEP